MNYIFGGSRRFEVIRKRIVSIYDYIVSDNLQRNYVVFLFNLYIKVIVAKPTLFCFYVTFAHKSFSSLLSKFTKQCFIDCKDSSLIFQSQNIEKLYVFFPTLLTIILEQDCKNALVEIAAKINKYMCTRKRNNLFNLNRLNTHITLKVVRKICMLITKPPLINHRPPYTR